MSLIPLYDVLLELKVDKDTARAVVDDLASTKEVATKEDLLKLEIRLTNKMYGLSTAMVVVIIAAVGLMIKFF